MRLQAVYVLFMLSLIIVLTEILSMLASKIL